MFRSQKDVETILSALGEQLEQITKDHFELLVCGGSALNILGLVERRNEKGARDGGCLFRMPGNSGRHFERSEKSRYNYRFLVTPLLEMTLG